MPYIVVKSNGLEIDRRELTHGMVIGRAPDCDVTVRDILLSRRHCRLEQDGEEWVVQDLQSKNGTAINGERLGGTRTLADNDVIRLGRAKIIFYAGFPDEDVAERLSAPFRPHNPGDSLAGTLSGFTLLLPGEGESPENMPCPQPRPKNPPTYSQEELQTLLSAIASSSWDSVYAEARMPLRRQQSSDVEDESKQRRRVRPESPTDFSLQVSAGAPAAMMEEAKPVSVKAKVFVRRAGFKPHLHVAVAALWIVTLMILNMNRKPVAGGATANQFDTPAMAVGYVDLNKADEQLLMKRSVNRGVAIKMPSGGVIARIALFYLPVIH